MKKYLIVFFAAIFLFTPAVFAEPVSDGDLAMFEVKYYVYPDQNGEYIYWDQCFEVLNNAPHDVIDYEYEYSGYVFKGWSSEPGGEVEYRKGDIVVIGYPDYGMNFYAVWSKITASGTCGDGLTWTLDDFGDITVSGEGEMEKYRSYTSAPWYSKRSSIKGVIIKEGVKSISNEAFYNCDRIESVHISSTVETIGYRAFGDCDKLSSFTTEYYTSLKTIGTSCFESCEQLTSVYLPDSLESIGSHAFSGCSGLMEMTVPEGVSEIGGGAFSFCVNLSGIGVSDGNENYKSVDGVLYTYDETILVQYPAGKKTKAYKISDKTSQIMQYAFENSKYLESVHIPAGVSSIENYTFSECKRLKNVTFGSGSLLHTIGYRAFADCESLTGIILPKYVKQIYGSVFYNCTSLKTVNIPDDTETIGSNVFYGCESLERISIPKKVKSIGENAFSGCRSLEEIKVDANNLYYCSDLGGVLYNKDKTVLICYPAENPSAVFEFPESVSEIGKYAFAYSNNLTEIALPESIIKIGDSAFKGSRKLECVSISKGVKELPGFVFEECPKLREVRFSDVQKIGYYAFSNCDVLNDITIPACVTAIENYAFSGTPVTIHCAQNSAAHNYAVNNVIPYDCSLNNSSWRPSVSGYGTFTNGVSWKLYSNFVLEISGNGALPDFEYDRYYYSYSTPWHKYKNKISKLVVCEGITSIGKYAFAELGNLCGAVLPESLEKIGEQAFYKCSKLVSIQIPANVSELGKSTFYQCEKLRNVSYADNSRITSVGYQTFRYCKSLESIVIPDGVTEIGWGAFDGCEKAKEIHIPKSVHTIDDEAFYGCYAVEKITVDESSTYYSTDKYGVLYNKSKTELIKFPTGCKLERFVIPDGVKTVGYCSFMGSDLVSITLPDTVETIEYSAFSSCRRLEHVKLGNSLKTIGDYSFGHNEALERISIPASVKEIQRSAFTSCYALKEITIPEGVTEIGWSTFYYCSDLEKIAIPASVKKIDATALQYINNLTIYGTNGSYAQSFASANNIRFESIGNLRYNIRFDSNGGTGSFSSVYKSYGSPAYLPMYIPELDDYDFMGWSTVKDGDVEYQSYGVYNDNCSAVLYAVWGEIPIASGECGNGITWKITKNGTLTISGEGAMKDWSTASSVPWNSLASQITSISVEEGITYVGKYAFSEVGTNSVTLPESLVSIGENAFSRNTSLITVTIPDGVITMGQYAFHGCEKLENVIFGEESCLEEISVGAFEECTKLEKIALPSSVKSVRTRAFKECTALKYVTLSDKLKVVEKYAFKDCINLVEIFIPAEVMGIGADAFYGCTKLERINVDPQSTVFSSDENGVLYNKEKTRLVHYPDANTASEYKLPASVIKIPEDNPFYKAKFLEKITADKDNTVFSSDENGVLYNKDKTVLAAYPDGNRSACFRVPSGVKEIAQDAFDNNLYLVSITLPDGVERIGNSAFVHSASLKNVVIPPSVTVIESLAFFYAGGMANVIKIYGIEESYAQEYAEGDSFAEFISLGDAVYYGTCGNDMVWTVNGDGVLEFKGSGRMTAVSSAEKSPWNYCAQYIKSAYIPSWLTDIDFKAFNRCESLVSFTADADNNVYFSDENGILLNKDKNTILRYPDGKTAASFEVPEGITSIGEYAFAGCRGITALTVHNGVVSIDATAFDGCDGLVIYAHDGSYAASFADLNGIPFISLDTGVILYNGTCGDLSWTINDKNTLTVYGEGVMTEFSSVSDAPWYEYKDIIKNAVIKSGVTSVGKNAFREYTGLVAAELSDTVASIGGYAFSGCTALTAVNIPASVTAISDGAFEKCIKLESITVDEQNANYASDARGALYNKSMTTLYQYPLGNISESYDVPEGVTRLNYGAFYCSVNLEYVNLPDTLKVISNSVFRESKKLKEIIIPDSVHTLGGYVFTKCTALEKAVVPAGVVTIGRVSFGSCGSLTVYGTKGSTAETYMKARSIPFVATDDEFTVSYDANGGQGAPEEQIKKYGEALTLSDKIPTRDGYDFAGWATLLNGNPKYVSGSAYTEEKAVTLYAAWRFSIIDSGTCGEDILWELDSGNTLTISGKGAIDDYTAENPAPWSGIIDKAESIVISDGITAVGTGAFSGFEKVTEVTICGEVAEIKSDAFENCNAITDVYYTDTEEKWNNLFILSGNEKLLSDNVQFEYSPVVYEGDCGENAKWKLDMNGTLTVHGEGAMTDYASDTDTEWYALKDEIIKIVISDGITSVGKNSFKNLVNLTQISFADSVCAIGANAFSGTKLLRTVNIPENLVTISDGAFEKCIGLNEFNVADGNASYSSADGVLFNKDKTTLVQYPLGNGRTVYSVPEGVTRLNYGSFYQSQNLTGIRMPSTLKVVSNSVFRESRKLESIAFSESLTTIGGYVFNGCTALESVYIPKTTTTIGSVTFGECEDLTVYGYSGSKAQTYCKSRSISFSTVDGTEYTVTYDMNDESDSALYGESITVSSSSYEREGKDFIGWHDMYGNKYAPGSSHIFNENTLLYADFVNSICNVYFELTDGIGIQSQPAECGSEFVIPVQIPVRERYEFVAWQDGEQNIYAPGDSFTVSGDVTLTAQWVQKEYELVWIVNKTILTEIVYGGSNATVMTEIPVKDNYTFEGWEDTSGNIYSSGESITVDSDLTFTPVWKANVFSITYDAAGGDGAPESVQAEYDSFFVVSDIIPTRDGYTFMAWEDQNGNRYLRGSSLRVTGDIVFNAVWQMDETTVYGDFDGDGVVSVRDVIGILQHLAGGTELTQTQAKVGDANADGSVNISDAIRILQYIASPTTPLGPGA